ncbi:MAG: gamma-glutamylcyclotransferase family protein [Pseudomonadota bacterium]
MKKNIMLTTALFFLINSALADTCHPTIDPSQNNYIIGYGSLMNNASRSQTNPDVTVLLPVKVKGLVRDWSAASHDYKIIFLGASQCHKKDENCFLNGLAYLTNDIQATDKRESIYCRHEVPINDITLYKKQDHLDQHAHYWVYITKKHNKAHPDALHPLIQSYVDLFIGGCMEQAASIAHKTVSELVYPNDYEFVFDCVKGTRGWITNYWLNDRVYPQRPWAVNPYALQIDKVLSQSYKNGDISGKYSYKDIPLEK